MLDLPASRPTVLVVEADAALLSMLDDVLTDGGFAPTCCSSGSQAIRLLSERCFDVLLLDVALPDVSGLQICEQSRSRYGYRIAIIAMSGSRRRQRSVTVLELGADDFLAKLFAVEELLSRITRVLERGHAAP